MIFVWSGKGGWIPCSLVVSLLLMMGVDQWLLPPEPRVWPVTLALALAGLFCVGLGLDGRFRPARRVFDRKTGRERFVRPAHSAYWIRAEYWGLLYLALAVWLQRIVPPGGFR